MIVFIYVFRVLNGEAVIPANQSPLARFTFSLGTITCFSEASRAASRSFTQPLGPVTRLKFLWNSLEVLQSERMSGRSHSRGEGDWTCTEPGYVCYLRVTNLHLQLLLLSYSVRKA